MRSATCRPAAAESHRGMPSLVAGYQGQAGEIMIANEQGIVVEHLSARRLVVGIVQPHQSVSQKWSELTPSVGRFLRRARRLDDLNEGSACLQLGVAIVVEATSPSCSFATGKHRPGPLEFSKFVCECNQSLRGRLSIR